MVLFTSSPKNGGWVDGAHAIINAHYPQTSGAQAITDVVFGKQVPSGKMATTWPREWECDDRGQCTVLPARLLGSNVTYRYGANTLTPGSNVLFPFGFGLSYMGFTYSDLSHAAAVSACEALVINVTVTSSKLAEQADVYHTSEIVQVYLSWTELGGGRVDSGVRIRTPELQLVAFEKVAVPAGGTVTVAMTLLPRHFAVLTGAATNASHFLDKAFENVSHPVAPVWKVMPGAFTLYVGGQQPSYSKPESGVRGGDHAGGGDGGGGGVDAAVGIGGGGVGTSGRMAAMDAGVRGVGAGVQMGVPARATSNVIQSTFVVTGAAPTPLDSCPGGVPS